VTWRYHTLRSPTFGNWFFCHGFLVDGDPKPAVASMKARLRIYPLAARDKPPEQKFVILSARLLPKVLAKIDVATRPSCA